jgi:tetratricopeptide (TPR) repeat protein
MRRPVIKQVIRVQQPLFWLLIAGLLLTGAVSAGDLYHYGLRVMGAIFLLMLSGFVWDAVVFDGKTLRRRGPGAWLWKFVTGQPCILTLDQVETISTYLINAPSRRTAPVYQTVICGAGVRWVITSRQRQYRPFIKSLFHLVSHNKLDPRSRDLMDYWQEKKSLKKLKAGSAELQVSTSPRFWRRLANQYALEGRLEEASMYFRLAYRRDPRNARQLYEMGRFLLLRAMLENKPHNIRKRLPRGLTSREACLRRAEACFRRAAWYGRGDAALLERIGEVCFEFHQDRLAEQYFNRAVNADSTRLRAYIGLAEINFRRGRLAHVILFYRRAASLIEEGPDLSLARLAESRADYYDRLRGDQGFLDAEAGRLSMLDQLKLARRGTLLVFVLAWIGHLAFPFSPAEMQAIVREICATAGILWLITIAATYIFSLKRN